ADRVHRAARSGEAQEQQNVTALSAIEREREVTFLERWNRRLIEGVLAHGFRSQRLLSEAVVTARGESPQNRPEGAKCAVQGVCSGKLLVVQQDKKIASDQEGVPLYWRIAEALTCLGYRLAHDLWGNSLRRLRSLRLRRTALGRQVAEVVGVSCGRTFRPQFVNGQERVKHSDEGLVGNRVRRPLGIGFESPLDGVREQYPLGPG